MGNERPKHTVRGSGGALPEPPRVQVRARTADRRAQITRVALELVAKHGIQGVFLSRIAAAIGISDAALYKHFASKDDILIAAHDLLARKVFDWIESFDDSSILVRFQKIGESHARLFSKDIAGFNAPMLQFHVWIPDDRVRAHVDRTHRQLMDAFANLLEEGKAQGSVRADADTELVVSQLYAWIWWEDLSYLSELDQESVKKTSADMFGRILQDIAVPEKAADRL